MTAPEWAVEAWRAAGKAHCDAPYGTPYDEAAETAAALELSRRCVPVEEYQRVMGALSDAIALIDTGCRWTLRRLSLDRPEQSHD